jgi:Domain of unknown function (DUF4365)
LQSLDPVSIARPPANLGYDLLVSFKNSRGGMNTFGVVLKATEQTEPSFVVVDRRTYDLLAHSTIQGFLFVADVKRDKLYYAWPPRLDTKQSKPRTIRVRITPINEKNKKELREKFIA